MDDVTLIRRCQQGDVDAFESLFQQYSTKALRTAYLLTGRQHIAEDITQESFIQCYREIKRLRHPEAFQAWFYRILVRISWRVLSKEKGRLSLETLNDSDHEFLISDASVSEAVETKQMQDVLHQALNKLSAPLRTAIILHYFNEFSIKEISEVLGCRAGTVKSRLHNARKRLADEIKQGELGFTFEEEPCFDEEVMEKQRKECETSAKTSTV
ncbi:MAG: sigma-70 family RNA polymerase sigma factor [Actinobacteria bacterium]|nr:sigma-70 family RNA polymerase sigma factor [Actinomycetota bacterium]